MATGSKSTWTRKAVAYTRNGLDWSESFSVIAGALDIPGQAIIDGEVVVIHEGRTNFSELQAELAGETAVCKAERGIDGFLPKDRPTLRDFPWGFARVP
jgi:ATP-dependent DNA ligase